MWFWLVAVALAATPPTVSLQWKADEGEILISAPEGEHFADDAPIDLEVLWGERRLHLEGASALLPRGLAVPELAGSDVDIALIASLCTDESNQCRQVEASLSVELPDTKKGKWRGELEEGAVASESMSDTIRGDGGARFEAALKQAASAGSLVMLDFSAVWCPPCNQLAAELLHQDPLPEPLDQLVIAVIDVDDPAGWAVKDRYQVGRYPTVVMTDAEGEELGRLVGYPGREDFLAWVEHIGSAATEESTASRAARDAWSRRGDGLEAIAPLLKKAEAEPDNVYFRIARLSVQPNRADIEWLLEEAPERSASWLSSVSEWLYETDPALAHRVVRTGLKEGPASAHPDLLSAAASFTEGQAKTDLYAAAAASLESQFSGDPASDRANYTWYAWLLRQAGDMDGAVDFLREAQRVFPDEPTYYMSAGSALLQAERLDEALADSERGLALAWGDNRLRAVALHGEILLAKGQEEAMRALVQEALATEAPEEGLSVRTHRYRAALEAMLASDVEEE
jgi:tetratricopeptide (TPR) repeat protein